VTVISIFLYLYQYEPNLLPMKKTFLAFILSLLIISVSAQEKKVKTGWNFGGALPAVTYDSDLGFSTELLQNFLIMEIRVYIPISSIILIQKYHVTPREVAFTGLCLNQTTSFPEYNG